MPKKIYIAGPMRGKQNLNYDAFKKAELDLVAAGYQAINPHHLGEQIQDEKLWTKEYLATVLLNDLYHLSICDCGALLPGWGLSRGAIVEYSFAEYLKMPVMTVNNWLEAAKLEKEICQDGN